MEEEMKIQIFDGNSYNIWKKCDEAAIRLKLPTDSETTWHKKTSEQLIIYIAVSVTIN